MQRRRWFGRAAHAHGSITVRFAVSDRGRIAIAGRIELAERQREYRLYVPVQRFDGRTRVDRAARIGRERRASRRAKQNAALDGDDEFDVPPRHRLQRHD